MAKIDTIYLQMRWQVLLQLTNDPYCSSQFQLVDTDAERIVSNN